MKTCTQCYNKKPLVDFYLCKKGAAIRASACKVCANQAAATRRVTHKSQIKAVRGIYRAANKDKINAINAHYRVMHPDTVKASNATHHAINNKNRLAANIVWRLVNIVRAKATCAEWSRQNPGIRAALAAKRRARRLCATPLWADLQAIKDYYITAAALSMHTGEHYHVDHIIPLQGKKVCGLHVENNLQILTAFDNLSKSNKYI